MIAENANGKDGDGEEVAALVRTSGELGQEVRAVLCNASVLSHSAGTADELTSLCDDVPEELRVMRASWHVIDPGRTGLKRQEAMAMYSEGWDVSTRSAKSSEDVLRKSEAMVCSLYVRCCRRRQ
jgi:hypothetical protein